MMLDIKTLMISILSISFIFVLSFSLYASGEKTQRGFRIWAISIFVQGTGYIFFILRGTIPDLLSITVGNGFFVLAASLRLDSITRFVQNKKIGRLYYIIPVFVALSTGAFYLIIDSIMIRNVITTIGISVLTIYTGLKFIIYAPQKERHIYYFFAFFVFLIVTSLIIRGIYWMSHPDQTLFTGSNIHSLHFFFDLLGQVGTNALFIMIYSKNAEARLSHAMEELHETAVRDKLTGLFNRLKIDEILLHETNRSIRYGHPVSVIIADIDFFKSVNDRFGHLEGDIVLRKVSKHIKECIRSVDYAGRWGGEEFIIILPETDAVHAINVGEKIQKTMHLQSATEMLPEGVTVSLGVGQLEEGDTVNDLLRKADDALYTAKEKGRNRIEAYRPD